MKEKCKGKGVKLRDEGGRWQEINHVLYAGDAVFIVEPRDNIEHILYEYEST